MLVCPKCGHDNDLGRIFCHGCGVKLDLDSIKPPAVRQAKAAGRGRILWRILDVVILVFGVWAVYLVLQVVEVPPASPDNPGLITLEKKRMDLDKAETYGVARAIVLTEAELNALFAGLGFGKEAGKGLELVPQRMQATLAEGTVTMVLVEKLQWGSSFSKELSFTFIGRPVVRAGVFQFETTGGALGKLPLHPQLLGATGFTERLLGGLLRNLTYEKELLDKLETIVVAPGKVTLQTAGK